MSGPAATAADWRIRPIRPADDAVMAAIIRRVMPEFGADGPGFAIHDAEVDHLSRAYARPRAAYFVVERAGRVQGGGGIAPLEGGPVDVCELRKMYFLPELRGRGAGRALLEHCLATAATLGFRQCYLETLTGMDAAAHLYLSAGFAALPGPMGATGHFACDRYFVKAL